MQPDPAVFLPIIVSSVRRLLDPALDSDNKQKFGAIANRALIQMRLRQERLGQIVRQFEPALRDVIGQAERWLRTAAIPLPATTETAEVRWQQLTRRTDTLLRQVAERIAHAKQNGVPAFMAAAARCQHQFRKACAAAEQELDGESPERPDAPVLNLRALENVLRGSWAGAQNLDAQRAVPVGGTHSKEIYIVDVENAPHGDRKVVVRRDPSAPIAGTSVSHEYTLLQGLHSLGAAVPEPIGSTAVGGELERAAVITRHADGAEYYRVADIPEPRRLLLQCARFLAQLHTTSPAKVGFSQAEAGKRAGERIEAFVRRHYLWWHEVAEDGSAEMECAYSWLMQHVAMVADVACVNHGDFDIRNFLVTTGGLNVVLDWELAHIGHPAEDLGYIRNSVETAMPWGEFLAEYQAAGGPRVTPESLRYCQVMGDFRNVVLAGSAFHLYRTAKVRDPFMAAVGITMLPLNLTILGDSFEKALGEYP